MAQHDHNIANADGATVRADLNSLFQAIAENNAAGTAPPVTFPHQWWFDESTNDLKQRNAANTAWVLVSRKDGSGWTSYRQGTLLGTLATKNAAALDATLVMSGKPIELARGADVASAATTDIWTPDDGNIVAITGTATITSLGTAPQAGAVRICIASGAFTLTHSASLSLPTLADVPVAAGDFFIVVATTTTNMKVAFYQRADGTPLAQSGSFNAVASTTIASITASATHIFTHGLGKVPELVLAYLVNTNGELGYVVGDRVAVTSHGANNAADVNLQVVADATNVRVVTGVAIHLLHLITKSWDPITLGNWALHIRAYAE